MADEKKTEQTDAEKLIEGLGAGSEGEGGKESVEEKGSPSEKEQKDVKGWTTVLPKKFREEAKEYRNLESYLDALKKKTAEDSESTETDEVWEEAIKSVGAEASRDKAILNAMRTNGIGSEKAKSLYMALSLERQTEEAESAKATRKLVNEHLARRAKETDNYAAVVQNGLRTLSVSAPDTFLELKNRGLINSPAVIDMVYMLGSTDTEGAPMSSRSGGKKDDYDPLNPLRFKSNRKG